MKYYLPSRDSMSGTVNTDENGTKIQAVKLENVLKKVNHTIIKMDIEGAEFDALHGGKEIIKINKPKLAICIYHSAEDLRRIPIYIKFST